MLSEESLFLLTEDFAVYKQVSILCWEIKAVLRSRVNSDRLCQKHISYSVLDSELMTGCCTIVLPYFHQSSHSGKLVSTQFNKLWVKIHAQKTQNVCHSKLQCITFKTETHRESVTR